MGTNGQLGLGSLEDAATPRPVAFVDKDGRRQWTRGRRAAIAAARDRGRPRPELGALAARTVASPGAAAYPPSQQPPHLSLGGDDAPSSAAVAAAAAAAMYAEDDDALRPPSPAPLSDASADRVVAVSCGGAHTACVMGTRRRRRARAPRVSP